MPAPITVAAAASTLRQVSLSRVWRSNSNSGALTTPASSSHSGGHHGCAAACCSHGCSAACAEMPRKADVASRTNSSGSPKNM
ncbi:hypothetical protein NB723_003597 [Xanthomonas sacchari]|nr:hypothetical protein [Xanthomonas sacchari]